MISNNFQKYKSKNFLKIFLLKKFINKILLIIKKIETDKILDVGCGEGFIIKRILAEIPNLEIEGIDISEAALAQAKLLAPNQNYYLGDIKNLPFKNNYCQLILAIEVLEHINEYEPALKELKRVTSKYCLLSVPYEPFFSLSNLIFGKNILNLGKDKEHLNFWNKKEIKNIIKKHFKILKIEISFPWIIILGEKYE